ncbi:MAG: hypothetical protein GC157_18545 [Frankiales bacterium]|nr:hypothetical protein [Frankiales bacterium]
METSLAPGAACNTCGYRITTASSTMEEAVPATGDVSICLACAAIEIFVDSPTGLVTRSATELEYREYMTDERVLPAVVMIRVGRLDPKWPGHREDTP